MGKADVISEIGIEITEFRTNMANAVKSIDATTAATNQLDKATKAAGKSQDAASSEIQKAAKKTAYQTGQVAMQLQDVAVQAQMGTGALQIFAQQGSQLASVFGGAKSAIVGGGIAIGAALVYAAVESEKAFANLITEANGVQNALSGIAANGSMNAVVKGFEQSSDEVGKLESKIESLGGFWSGLWEDGKALATFGELETTYEKIASTEKEIAELHERDALLIERFRIVSAESLKIAEMHAAGEHDAANALERQLKLKQELEGITGGKGSEEAKVLQRDLARDLAAIKEKEIANKKAADDEKKAADDERHFADEEFRAMTEFYSEQEKEEAKANADFEKHSDARLKNLQEIDDFNADMRKRQEQADAEELKSRERLADVAGKMLAEMRDEEIEALDKRIAKQKKERETLADAAREALANQKKINDERDKYYAKGAAAGRKFDRQQIKDAKELAVGARRRATQDAKRAGRAQPVRGAAGFAQPQPMQQPNAPAAPANGGQGGAVAVMQVASLVVGELKSK